MKRNDREIMNDNKFCYSLTNSKARIKVKRRFQKSKRQIVKEFIRKEINI